jgi:hypothetical protein
LLGPDADRTTPAKDVSERTTDEPEAADGSLSVTRSVRRL